jgi:SAM-dependent methyltransferase
MRPSVKTFVGVVAKHLKIPEPIYEFGALQVPGQEDFANLRPFFPGKQYVGCDYREGPGVDKVLDLHQIDLPNESVGTVISVDTLEHVEEPFRALKEIHRILKPDGVAVITSVMNFPIHAYPYDYWCFTPEAFKSILKPFAHVFVDAAGAREFPDVVVGLGFKGPPPPLDAFKTAHEKWRRGHKWSLEYLARAIVPPAILPSMLGIRRSLLRIVGAG